MPALPPPAIKKGCEPFARQGKFPDDCSFAFYLSAHENTTVICKRR
jgi:hypothetical protein